MRRFGFREFVWLLVGAALCFAAVSTATLLRQVQDDHQRLHEVQTQAEADRKLLHDVAAVVRDAQQRAAAVTPPAPPATGPTP